MGHPAGPCRKQHEKGGATSSLRFPEWEWFQKRVWDHRSGFRADGIQGLVSHNSAEGIPAPHAWDAASGTLRGAFPPRVRFVRRAVPSEPISQAGATVWLGRATLRIALRLFFFR